MIESDIRSIKKTQRASHTKTDGVLKGLSAWQAKHERSNNRQFKIISQSLGELPTQEVITKTIQDTIKTVVNGKIDHLTELVNTTTGKVDMVGEHLRQQDTAIEEINNKIKPVIGSIEWLGDTKKVLLSLGAICLAILGIVELLKALKVL